MKHSTYAKRGSLAPTAEKVAAVKADEFVRWTGGSNLGRDAECYRRGFLDAVKWLCDSGLSTQAWWADR